MVFELTVFELMAKFIIYLFILLSVLTACTSGPVPVRDITATPSTEVSTPANEGKLVIPSNQSVTTDSDALEIAPSIIKPNPTPVPLNDKLKQQAEQSLRQQRWQQAILFAERGLRINRKEPFFYWVLSTAYQQLSEIQKSIDFARQGLRYIVDDGGLKSQLKSLAAQ